MIGEELNNTVFDYDLQCWVVNGLIQRCGHPEAMDCTCIGKQYAGRIWSEVRYVRGLPEIEAEPCASCSGKVLPGTGGKINANEWMCDRCWDDGNFPSRSSVNHDPGMDCLQD